MPELLATLEAARKVETRTHKIMAALQGAEWPDDETKGESGATFEEIERRAKLRVMGKDPDANDVVDVYGIEDGIVYESE